MTKSGYIKKGDLVSSVGLPGVVIRVAKDRSWADVMFNWYGETWPKRKKYKALTLRTSETYQVTDPEEY